jgi:hypothetical protein
MRYIIGRLVRAQRLRAKLHELRAAQERLREIQAEQERRRLLGELDALEAESWRRYDACQER